MMSFRPSLTYATIVLGLMGAGIVVSIVIAGQPTSAVGRDVPDALRGETHLEKTLVWVITRDAYASCRQPAYVLRRIKQQYGDAVPLVVLYAEHEKDDVRRILTRERLSAKLLPLNVPAYERFFDHPPEPALHFIEEGRVMKSWSYTSSPILVDEVVTLF